MSRDTLHRRKRHQPVSTGKRIVLTERDIRIFEMLERHGPLPSTYLYQLTKHLGRNETRLVQRLGDLYHEANTPHGGPYLDRPWQQLASMNARYQPTVSAVNNRARAVLLERGKGNRYAGPASGPYVHAFMTSCITASIDLEAARAGFGYITQEALLASPTCPQATRDAEQPLAMPVTIVHTFPHTDTRRSQRSTHAVIPDQIFAIEYAPGKRRYFALEVDRATQPIFRSNLTQSSYLRKALGYREIARQKTYESHFGFPHLLVLNVTVNATHKNNLLALVRQISAKPDGSHGNAYLLFKYVPHFERHLIVPPVLSELFSGTWERSGREGFFLNRI